MSSETPEDKKRVEEALKDSAKLKELVEALSDGSRRGRQQAAKVIAGVAAENPEILVPFASDLVDALERPEAQTRWECLDALTYVVPFDSRPCDKAIPGAEAALFDEISAPLRLSAFRFLVVWGATERRRSEKVWPIIDEAIQCYHGDLEYRDMLALLFSFAHGQISGSVAAELAGRLQFDAENGKGSYLRVRSREIYDALVKRFKLDNPQKKVRAKKSDAEDEDEE